MKSSASSPAPPGSGPARCDANESALRHTRQRAWQSFPLVAPLGEALRGRPHGRPSLIRQSQATVSGDLSLTRMHPYAPREGVACRLSHPADLKLRSEEHTSELQSLMRISYAVFCLKKKKKK